MVAGYDHGSEGYGFISLENIALPVEDERLPRVLYDCSTVVEHTPRFKVVMGSYPLRAHLPLYFL